MASWDSVHLIRGLRRMSGLLYKVFELGPVSRELGDGDSKGFHFSILFSGWDAIAIIPRPGPT